MPKIILDLTKRHFTVRRGPLNAIGSWVRLENRWQPCLVLVRSLEEMAAITVPCIVPLKDAHIWFEDFGNPQRAAHIAVGFVEALRLTGGPKSAMFVARTIHGLLEDLMKIPPYPYAAMDRAAAPVTGELTVINHSLGQTKETELRDDV